MLLGLVVLLPIDFLQAPLNFDFYGDFAISTIASLQIGSNYIYVHLVIASLFILMGGPFIFAVRRLGRTLVFTKEKNEKTSTIMSLFTIQIRGIPHAG